MISDIIDFYKKTIVFGDLVADEQGAVSHQVPGTDCVNAVTVAGRRLVIPTQTQLSNPEWENRFCFHPLVENQIGSESILHERFRRACAFAINLRVYYILAAIAKICSSESLEKRNTLGANYAPIWQATSGADDKFLKNLLKYMESDPKFVHTIIRRGYTLNGEQRRVVCEVYFPAMEDIEKSKDRVVNNVKFRVSDIETINKIFELIFPGHKEKDSYSAYSDNSYSPTVFAMVSALDKIYSCTNRMFEQFPEIMEDRALIQEISWIKPTIQNTSELSKNASGIGLLDGNGPKPKIASKNAPALIEVKSENANLIVTPAAQPQQVLQQPVQQLQQVQTNTQSTFVPLGGVPVAGAPVVQQQQNSVYQPVMAQAQNTQTKDNNVTIQKIGSDPSKLNNNVRTSSNTGYIIPKDNSTHQTQPTPVLMQTPQGVMAVNPISLEEASRIALQQQQAQQQAQIQAQQMQMKVAQAQALGYRVYNTGTGGYSVEVADGNGGVIYKPIAEWTPPNQQQAQAKPPAGAPVAAMQPVMPMAPVVPGVAAPNQVQLNPDGTIPLSAWVANNPAAAAMQQQLQQQQMMQQMMQMGAMNPMMMQQMMAAGMVPNNMMAMANPNAQYVPSHVRAANMMPGLIRPIGA